MVIRPSLRKWLGTGVAMSLAATTIALGASAAQAAPDLGSRAGSLAISPSTGNQDTLLQAATDAPCNPTDTGIVVYMSGPGITAGNDVLQGNTAIHQVTGPTGLSFQVSDPFLTVFQANAIASPSGTYTVRVACIGEDFFTETGEFTQSFTMTPNGAQNGANYVAASTATSTTTTLGTPTPADPVAQGTPTTLNATVTATSGDPEGSVQFKSGASNLGSPVPLSPADAAQYVGALPAGSNSITAQFVPSAPQFYASSTSAAVSYVVAGNASITGTPKVGAKLTCAIAAGGTISYQWANNGTDVAGVTTKDVTVPAGWLNGNVTCKATVTKNANSVTQTSAAKKIALGDAPKATVAPKLKGTFKVGRVITCVKGTWSPTPTSYKFAWKRGTKAINGATKATYKLVKADRGKKVSCVVTALKTGHASGKATSAPKMVS